MLEKIKKNTNYIMLALMAMLFLKQCGLNSDLSKIKKENSKITGTLDSSVTKQEMKKEMRQVMFEFLIYEEDFDKGRASLSDIKNKIESQDGK
jgi:hypothetical protein